MKKHVLIVGCGSIGKRHARNLSELGCKISGFDPRTDRQKEFNQEIDTTGIYSTYQDAFDNNQYDGVVIGSPTAFHVDQSIEALNRDIPILLEKPVAKTLQDAIKLREVAEETGIPILMGYTWRWWKPLEKVRQLIMNQRIGKIRHVQFHMSAHLADWHPWEPYQDFFMSSEKLGGGALLDESHWIDLMIWFFGMPKSIYAQVNKISDLDIDSDDNVDVLVSYADNLKVSIHLDLLGRPHEKFIRFIGEDGTIFWSVDPNQISMGTRPEQEWDREQFSCERNDMFMGVAREFYSVLNGQAIKSCTLEDGIRVMELIEAIRDSHMNQKAIRINS